MAGRGKRKGTIREMKRWRKEIIRKGKETDGNGEEEGKKTRDRGAEGRNREDGKIRRRTKDEWKNK